MELEYSRSKSNFYAYVFTSWERKVIAKALVPKIKQIEAQIYRVQNSEKNEGQAKYITKIQELRGQIKQINEIIKALNY
jgi:hypothetical protein